MKLYDYFEYPNLSKYHPLKRHVRYHKDLSKTFKKRCFGSRHCGHFKCILIKAEANLIVSALINLLNL